MILSNDEMMGLNVLVGNTGFREIPLNWDTNDMSEKQKIKCVLNSLQEKGIVDEKAVFTKEGHLLLLILRKYNAADRIIKINQMRIALCENDLAIILLLKRDENYKLMAVDVHYVHKNMVINSIVFEQRDLGKSYNPFSIRKKFKIDFNEFFKEITKYDIEKMIFVGDGQNQDDSDYVFYWNDERCYCYYYKKEIREEWEVGAIRQRLLEVLEVE